MEHYHESKKNWDEREGIYEFNTLVFSAYKDLKCDCEYIGTLENELTKTLGWAYKGFVDENSINLETDNLDSIQLKKQKTGLIEDLYHLISHRRIPSFHLSVKAKSRNAKPICELFDRLTKVGIKKLPEAS
ncbi:hypothetical protein HY498_02220 [Candidatus Woesearchaeota archaeon]|nr:hypothetical protein [Candidatus Woesearchaeota archaeon]